MGAADTLSVPIFRSVDQALPGLGLTLQVLFAQYLGLVSTRRLLRSRAFGMRLSG